METKSSIEVEAFHLKIFIYHLEEGEDILKKLSFIVIIQNQPLSSNDVKELVTTKLQNRFETDFTTKIISHDPVNRFYEMETYMDRKPDMTFFFTINEKDLNEDNPEDSEIDNIYRVVVHLLYKNELKKLVNQSLEDNQKKYQLKHLQIVPPDSADFKEKPFSRMNFAEYASTYREDTIYHLYFLVDENYNVDDLKEHDDMLKEFYKNLETNYIKNIRMVMIFPNDLFLDSDIVDIQSLQTESLQSVFSKEVNRNPSIPGFDYEEWKNSIMKDDGS